MKFIELDRLYFTTKRNAPVLLLFTCNYFLIKYPSRHTLNVKLISKRNDMFRLPSSCYMSCMSCLNKQVGTLFI
jgi:hypothetical protein